MASKKKNKHVVPHIAIAVAAAALITLFVPKESATSYNYTQGSPWTYSLLTAPFDIPITLDPATESAKRDSICRAFVPIFKRDQTVGEDAALDLRAELQAKTSLPAYDRALVTALVRQIYEQGIVDNDTYALIASGQLPEVRFIVDNVAEPCSTAGFRSVRVAYAVLDSAFADTGAQTALAQVGATRFLNPNVWRDTLESDRLLDQICQKELAASGMVQKGERIIDRGDIVTPQIYQILKTYEKLAQERIAAKEDLQYSIAGKTAIIVALIAALYLFLIFYRKSIIGNLKETAFIVLLLTAFTVASYVVIPMSGLGMYMVPLAIIPVMITTFFDSRTALFAHIVETLLCSLVVPYPHQFIIMQSLTGLTAIISVQELSRRSQLVRCAVLVFLVYCFTYVAMHVATDGTVDGVTMAAFGGFVINVVLFSFTYVLIYLAERLLGFTSTVTLVELSDVNNPILRELSEKCPGTFQHSLQMSNLATEAARAIGANDLLVRAGAMYHDIGKIDNPAFFTENQRGVNPHKTLPPEVSAQIVIEHVRNGLRRAAKAKLPGVVMDFITQHHGCGKARYFYTQACNASPDGQVDPTPYTYPGPNPQTKETAILMMADATEAASRSLPEYTDETIERLVERIIDGQIAEGCFKESPISFRDVEIIKRTFTERLRTIYHVRIAYPEMAANKKA